MPDLYISLHAVERYRQRVADISDSEVYDRLSGPAFKAAAEFGAPFVRLSGGQRAVIVEHSVVTILPADHSPGSLNRGRDEYASNG